MPAFRLLYSFRSSLFFSWSFFLYATSSAVSGCFWVFRSVTRSDLRFPFVTGLPVGTSPFSFLLALRLFLRLLQQIFLLVFPWFSYFFLYQGFTLFLRLFAWIRSSLFLVWEVVPSIFSSFSLCSDFLDYSFGLFCLRCSSVGFFAIFFLCWGFFLPGLSPNPWSFHRLVSSGFSLPILFRTFSFMLFFVSLVHPLRLACFGHGLFLRFSFLVRLSLFLSTGRILSFSEGFLKCLIPSLLRVVLFSSRFSVFHVSSTSSLLPLPHSFRILSICGCGRASIVFFLYAFLLFGFPS